MITHKHKHTHTHIHTKPNYCRPWNMWQIVSICPCESLRLAKHHTVSSTYNVYHCNRYCYHLKIPIKYFGNFPRCKFEITISKTFSTHQISCFTCAFHFVAQPQILRQTELRHKLQNHVFIRSIPAQTQILYLLNTYTYAPYNCSVRHQYRANISEKLHATYKREK